MEPVEISKKGEGHKKNLVKRCYREHWSESWSRQTKFDLMLGGGGLHNPRSQVYICSHIQVLDISMERACLFFWGGNHRSPRRGSEFRYVGVLWPLAGYHKWRHTCLPPQIDCSPTRELVIFFAKKMSMVHKKKLKPCKTGKMSNKILVKFGEGGESTPTHRSSMNLCDPHLTTKLRSIFYTLVPWHVTIEASHRWEELTHNY